MMAPAARSATVVVPTLGGARLARMLESLAAQTAPHQTIVVDNGSADGSVAAAAERLAGAEVLRLERNAGYSRAVNLGAARADGEVLVLLNDDCVCEPRFVERIAAPIDPGAGVAMAAGVMRDWRHPALIDSAGMELDRTLLVFDYLNGEPVSVLAGGVADPIGPSAAAAAFDRSAFLGAGGFDERLFAYWEDVDLVLRLRRRGWRCSLAPEAIGDHAHSATLGSGSARKNYLMGYGRGYLLRKWGVLNARRIAAVAVREGALCAGQALYDRNLAGVRGRLDGFRDARPVERYPSELALGAAGPGAIANLARRRRRRGRLAAGPGDRTDRLERTLAVLHLAQTSGPSRSLARELGWLGEVSALDLVVPGPGSVEDELRPRATVIRRDYEALTAPSRGIRGLLGDLRRLWREVWQFRELLAERRPQLVVVVTSMLPAVAIAAALERVPILVYCGELFDRGFGAGAVRAFAGGRLAALTGRLADSIIVCSNAVGRQFEGSRATRVRTVYPPISDRWGRGDGAALRERHGIPATAPVVASVGYLTDGRGQDLLVRAMPAVLEAFAEARCVIAGSPFPRPQDLAYRQYLVGLIAQLKLQERIVLAGYVDDAADLYAAANVVVNPARVNEAFGRVPFEAAVGGCPSVVTRVGAVTELLRDGHSALVVEPEDPAAIARAAIRLLAEPQLGEHLVAGARAVVDAHLAPERSLAGFRRAVAAAGAGGLRG